MSGFLLFWKEHNYIYFSHQCVTAKSLELSNGKIFLIDKDVFEIPWLYHH